MPAKHLEQLKQCNLQQNVYTLFLTLFPEIISAAYITQDIILSIVAEFPSHSYQYLLSR